MKVGQGRLLTIKTKNVTASLKVSLIAVFLCFNTILTAAMAATDNATKEFVIDPNQASQVISGRFPTQLETTSADITSIHQKGHFKLDGYESSLAPGSETYWYRLQFRLPENSQSKQFYLVFENTLITHLDAYIFQQNTLIHKAVLGAVDRRTKAQEYFKGVNLPLDFSQSDSLTVYLKKQSNSPAIMPMTLYSEQAHTRHLNRQFLFWGGVIALLAAIAFYNATIYVLVKMRSYLWYLLFYAVTFFYFAGLHGYGSLLWSDEFQRWLTQHIITLNFILLWLVIRFANEFLSATDNAQWHAARIKWFDWTLPPGALLSLFLPEYQLIPVFGFFQLVGSIFAISMGVAAYRNQFYPARLFLASWSLLMVGAGIGMMTYTNIIRANFFTLHAFFFGALTELMLLSIALADRLRYSEKLAISRAYTDPQTKMPNYSFFISEYFAKQQLQRRSGRLAIMLVKLDGFSHLLGLLGPKGADRAFCSHIERIESFLQESQWAQPIELPNGVKNHLMVLPSDHLLIIAAIEDDYEAVVLPLIHLSEQRIRVGKLDNQLSMQIGVAEYAKQRGELQECYRHAQLALLKSRANRVPWSVYQPGDETLFVNKSALLADLRQAIEQEQLTIHIQPQFMASSRALCGGEVLVRWNHPNRGMISPGEFIPLAEESDLIFKISKLVINKAFDWLAEHRFIDADFQLSINLSGLDIQHSELVPYIRWQIERTSVKPHQVVFEVTESAASIDQVLFLDVIAQIQAMGFQIAIDDFGTGYSSMSYLQKMNADLIKIDMSFVRNIHESAINQKIVDSVISMARSTTATVVAEGVETEAELTKLNELGVDKIQGFLLGKPVPALSFEPHYLKTAAAQ